MVWNQCIFCIAFGMEWSLGFWKKKKGKEKGGCGIGMARNWIMDKIRNWPLNCHSDSLRPAAFKARELYQIWSPLHPFINWQFDTVLVLVYSFYFYFFFDSSCFGLFIATLAVCATWLLCFCVGVGGLGLPLHGLTCILEKLNVYLV